MHPKNALLLQNLQVENELQNIRILGSQYQNWITETRVTQGFSLSAQNSMLN